MTDSSVTVGGPDLRLASAGMLAAAAASPLWGSTVAADLITCPLRAVTGIPCPLCGMTTSVCATVTGRLGDAVSANPFGLLAVVVAIWLVVTWRRGVHRTWRIPLWLPCLGLALSWAWQLARLT